MVSSSALLSAAAAIFVLLASGIWAEFRFRGFHKLPAHFNAAGKPTRFASRSFFVIWLTPAIFSMLLGALLVLPAVLPAEHINRDHDDAIHIASAIIVAAQFFILWLLVRWARAHS